MNLITHASEALGEAGEVIESTGVMDADRAYPSESFFDEHLAEGRYIYLDVTDTGCGTDKKPRTGSSIRSSQRSFRDAF